MKLFYGCEDTFDYWVEDFSSFEKRGKGVMKWFHHFFIIIIFINGAKLDVVQHITGKNNENSL